MTPQIQPSPSGNAVVQVYSALTPMNGNTSEGQTLAMQNFQHVQPGLAACRYIPFCSMSDSIPQVSCVALDPKLSGSPWTP
eukprot:g22251.t1